MRQYHLEGIKDIRTKFNISENIRIYSTDFFMVYIGIETIKDSKIVKIYAPLYINKITDFSVSYSLDFSDFSILNCRYLKKYLFNCYKI